MMIFNKARMAKLSGILTESKKGIKDSMADQFGGGKEEGDPWLDGEVTTEGTEEDESSMMNELDDEDMKEGDEEELDEASLRRMIRSALSEAKKEMMDKKKAKGKGKGKAKGKDDEDEEKAVREAVRSEIKSVLRSRGVTLGGTGPGFKR
jgi:hypothetical protein